MGWDAFTQKADGSDAMMYSSRGGFEPQPEFLAAVVELKGRGVMVDGLLQYGGLDVTTCAYMLQAATKLDAWVPLWNVETVRDAAAKADWNFPVKVDEEWAKESAKAFLDTAAKLGLAVRFSW